MPKMGQSSAGLEGEPSGTHGKYTVKYKRDRKMWKIFYYNVFYYKEKTARREMYRILHSEAL